MNTYIINIITGFQLMRFSIKADNAELALLQVKKELSMLGYRKYEVITCLESEVN